MCFESNRCFKETQIRQISDSNGRISGASREQWTCGICSRSA